METHAFAGGRPMGGLQLHKTAKSPRLVARVTVRAIEPETKTNTGASQHVLLKIGKILARTHKSGCTEAEMQAATRLAGQYMQRYHVTQVDVYRAATANELDRSSVAGHSQVRISSVEEVKRVCISAWTKTVAGALARLYDCRCFSTSYGGGTRVKWTFYGIAVNTVAAAETFEAVYNTVLEWASLIKRGNKNSYCLGFAEGIRNLAAEEKTAELGRAANAARTTAAERGPAVPTKSLAYTVQGATDSFLPNSESVPSGFGDRISTDARDLDPIVDSDAEDGIEADIKAEEEAKIAFDPVDVDLPIEDEIKSFIKLPDPSSETTLAVDDDDAITTSAWQNSSDLVLYRSNARDIAKKYLSEGLNMKLKQVTRAPSAIRDYNAYCQGERDSTKVDIKRNKVANDAAAVYDCS